MNGKDLVMFFRFGSGLSGANRGYYEYTQRLQKGWAANEIVIDIDRLTRLKKEAEVSGTAEEVLSNGDIVRVVGKPSLGSIKAYAIGVRNLGTPVLLNKWNFDSADKYILQACNCNESSIIITKLSVNQKTSGLIQRSFFRPIFLLF